MSTHTPILFLHWLENPAEAREAKPIAEAIRNDINVRYEDVDGRSQVLEVIKDWLRGNDAAQYLFIGAHGDEDGLGDTVATGIDWPELGALLSEINKDIVLWLFACNSSTAADAWSPIPANAAAPAAWIVGFPDTVTPPQMAPVLRRLVEITGTDSFTFVEDELAEIRKAAGNVQVTLHYPAGAFHSCGPLRRHDVARV